jgi:solute carrier family 26, other
MFSSFFSCAPISASLSRSLVQQGVGGKTQVASLVACGLLLMVMLFIGPFFEPLPQVKFVLSTYHRILMRHFFQCVLAAIMVVTLKGMFLQVKDFPEILRKSKIEAVVWMGTFLVSILWDIDYGLGAGLLLSVLSAVLYGQKLQVQSLGLVPDSSIYLDAGCYKAVRVFFQM